MDKFRYGDHVIRFAAPYSLEYYTEVKEWDNKVITGFISALEAYGLSDKNGIYKAIGAIRSENASGLKIGSYWSEFDGTAKKKSEYNYWTLVDEIVQSLSNGKLYKTEQIVRKLLCQVFHYL